jgi:hypothetical protein
MISAQAYYYGAQEPAVILFVMDYPLRKNLIKTHKEIHENKLNTHSFCRDILVRLTAKYHLFDDF